MNITDSLSEEFFRTVLRNMPANERGANEIIKDVFFESSLKVQDKFELVGEIMGACLCGENGFITHFKLVKIKKGLIKMSFKSSPDKTEIIDIEDDEVVESYIDYVEELLENEDKERLFIDGVVDWKSLNQFKALVSLTKNVFRKIRKMID